MTLLTEKGIFTSRTTTGAQAVTLSGAFQPKALILWTSTQTTNDGTYADDALIAFGFSDGTNDASFSYQSDESAEVEYYHHSNTAILRMQTASTTLVNIATVNSFDTTGFTLGWTINQGTGYQVHYIAIGGTDITNVSVFTATVPDALTGNHSYNGSGTSFTPDFALAISGPSAVTTIDVTQTNIDNSFVCLGAATSASKQWVVWGRDETVSISDSNMYINPAQFVSGCSVTTGAISMLGDFISFNNAAGGGITINVSDAGASGTFQSFLLIKGGVWDVGTFQQRSGTGTQDVTLTAGLDPSLVFLTGINSATSATVVANLYLGYGASDGTNEGCSYVGNTAALGTWTAVRSNLNTKVYRQATPAATATSSTTNAECDMTDMATAGKFTLDWTTADTTLRRMAFFAVGTTAGAATVNQSIFIEWEEAS